MGRIKILFHNKGGGGVNYYRTLTPATELDREHNNLFDVEINQHIDFKDDYMDYLKKFDIIHYHKDLHPNISEMIKISRELKENNTILIIDIDDYWRLPKEHPLHHWHEENKTHLNTIENLKIADYVTTTSEFFAKQIKEITKKDNVFVFENAVNPEWMKQFENNWKPSEDGRVRITYMGGSSHLGDLRQLENVANVLNSDWELKDKFKIILAGWDAEGTTTDVTFNNEFASELQKHNLWNNNIIKEINRSRGNIDLISNLPIDIKEKFRNNVFIVNRRPIKSSESVYYEYEKILTDNHRIINDKNYVGWLMNFQRTDKFNDEGIFGRRWTQPVNKYAEVLNETDIVLAPLADNLFNKCKSNLKQVEVWSRKLPIVCSDTEPYNVDGRHLENTMLVPIKKNSHKYWARCLKRLILEPELREKLGNQLYDDFSEKYNLKTVTKRRADFYNTIIKNNKKEKC